jgi:ADP-ribose pyrophosphatase
MDDADLIEHTITTEPVFDGRLLKVHRDTVRLSDGHETIREWIAHPGAVVVIAMLDNGKLLFERQLSLAPNILELPAGKIDKTNTLGYSSP